MHAEPNNVDEPTGLRALDDPEGSFGLMVELNAHLISSRRIVTALVRHMESNEQDRLRMALKREQKRLARRGGHDEPDHAA